MVCVCCGVCCSIGNICVNSRRVCQKYVSRCCACVGAAWDEGPTVVLRFMHQAA